MRPAVDNMRVTQLINTIRSDGTWPGINYEDVSRTGFEHGKHLKHMVELCRAYKKRGSSFKGDRKLKWTIDAAGGINHHMADGAVTFDFKNTIDPLETKKAW